MLKPMLITAIIILFAGGLWFINLSGPQKLNAADRLYPASEPGGFIKKAGLAFGKHANQKLDIYIPKGAHDTKAPHPTLLFFHGGSWTNGEREGYGFLGRAFAARGYVAVIADYRKYPEVQFPAFVEDAASAIHWVKNNISAHQGNAENLFIMGHSAGAHIAMLAVLDPQYMAKYGLNSENVKGIIGLAGPYDFHPFETGGAAENALGNWQRPEETQPVYFARKNAPPMLLLTGDKDELVKPRNSNSLAKAMKAAGGENARVKIYPNVDHFDIIMAAALPFRGKAPMIDDAIDFMNPA